MAALVAAIVSSLGSMINSISTIFTMDLVKPLIAPKATEHQLVNTGRVASFVALVAALFLATPLLQQIVQRPELPLRSPARYDQSTHPGQLPAE